MHELKYLPLAQKDLKEIIGYIANSLKALQAAMDLLDILDRSGGCNNSPILARDISRKNPWKPTTEFCRYKITWCFM
jgi:hypothetical protein